MYPLPKDVIPIDLKPDILVSCGRKSVYFSLYCKKKFNGIINIHIQNPKVSLNNFNYIIAPEHDGISGKNVISSKGALHYLTIEEIEKSRDYLENKTNKKTITTVWKVSFFVGQTTRLAS